MSEKPFRRVAAAKVAEPELGDKVHRATVRTVEKRAHLVAEIPDWESLRRRARELRLDALDRREKLLDRLVRRLEERGASVTVAHSSEEACVAIVRLARHTGGEVIKSKSMASEEIGLNAALEAAGVTVTETDLGEWIVQQARQAPSHITAPAIHLSVEDVARIFHERAGIPLPDWIPPHPSPPPATSYRPPATPEPVRQSLARDLSLAARGILRERFLAARTGITGANFLVAESGTVVLLENEGNIRLTTCLPRRHIVLAGVEKLVARDEDLAVLLRLLPVSATAQRQSCYVSLLADRHPDLHVVLLDRGRTALAADREQRDLLTCIRCGACLNVCPVYRCVGGHAYGGAYAGPIGALLLPHFDGLERHPDLPFASSLCGACSETCPVGIPLHERLLELRARLVERGFARDLGWTMRRAASAMRSPSRIARALSLYRLVRPLVGGLPVARRWTAGRALPRPARETFRQWWARRTDRGRSQFSVLGQQPEPAGTLNRNPESAAAQPRAEARGSVPEVPRGSETENRELKTENRVRRIAQNPIDAFASRFADLGPAGETAFHHVATAAEATAIAGELLRGAERRSVIVEGEEPERREYAFGVTGAAALIADTGGVVLDLRRRDLAVPSLLVDTHVVVAHPSRLVADLPAFFRMRAEKRVRGDWYDVQVLVTGPSRTADIEKTLVIPAHGPRRMVVILCDEPLQPGNLVPWTDSG
ncbi:MAG: LUD domain-containing protein [Deltaproteobacteria bacterium]|nr:LUD domain-containing protein [Deltaproteobacteria bacterium]